MLEGPFAAAQFLVDQHEVAMGSSLGSAFSTQLLLRLAPDRALQGSASIFIFEFGNIITWVFWPTPNSS